MAATHELSKTKAAPGAPALERLGLHLGGPRRRSISCSCGWAVFAASDEDCERQAKYHTRNVGPSRAAKDRMRKAKARRATV